jgi:hypothetical protein
MSNGKGSADTRSPDMKKRREAWERIFGKKKQKKKGAK